MRQLNGKCSIIAHHNDEVKIQLSTRKEDTSIIKALTEITEFHTYISKQSRPFTVVKKNVKPSNKEENMKSNIQELEHEVINVWNFKQKISNK